MAIRHVQWRAASGSAILSVGPATGRWTEAVVKDVSDTTFTIQWCTRRGLEIAYASGVRQPATLYNSE